MNSIRVAVGEPGQVALEPFELPDPLPGQALIETQTTLISPGTERAFFMALPNTDARYPLVPGYSAIGRVIALGESVTGLAVGDRVAAAAPHAAHAAIEAARCVPVPEGVPNEDAVFFNLIAIAMQGVHKARIELGEPVAVVGVGPIGLFALQLARLNGALPAIAIDLDPRHLDLAQSFGADLALLNDADLPAALAQATHGAGPAVVIEASGVSAATVQAFQMAAVRGRVVLLGSARGETDGVNFYRDVHRKGLTIVGAHEITRPLADSLPGWWTQLDEHRIALRLLARGRLAPGPLISHRFGWRAFPQAYELLRNWDRGVFGMVIDWQG